jgi:hypothetical protein
VNKEKPIFDAVMSKRLSSSNTVEAILFNEAFFGVTAVVWVGVNALLGGRNDGCDIAAHLQSG